jgi:hypothetical protein
VWYGICHVSERLGFVSVSVGETNIDNSDSSSDVYDPVAKERHPRDFRLPHIRGVFMTNLFGVSCSSMSPTYL